MVRPALGTVPVAPGNLRVPYEEFLIVWREADRQGADAGSQDTAEDSGYVAAVAHTCRWMAAIPPRTALCGGLPRSPITQRACLARPESIEAEWQASAPDGSPADSDRPADPTERDGWLAGVRATLRWAWRGEGTRPLDPS